MPLHRPSYSRTTVSNLAIATGNLLPRVRNIKDEGKAVPIHIVRANKRGRDLPLLLHLLTLQSFVNLSLLFLKLLNKHIFWGWGCQLHAQQPTWRIIVFLFVWVITFDPSGIGGPTNNYVTASIPLGIIWPRKPHHYAKVRLLSGGEK